MRDKKFGIALSIIIVLAIALLYITVISPKIQGYVIGREAQAQENVVNAILGIVEQQGYVAIGDGENSVVLVKYDPNPAQLVQDPELNSGNEIAELN